MNKNEIIHKWENIIANKEKRVKAIQAKSFDTNDIGTLHRLIDEKNAEQAGIIIINAVLDDIKGME